MWGEFGGLSCFIDLAIRAWRQSLPQGLRRSWKVQPIQDVELTERTLQQSSVGPPRSPSVSCGSPLHNSPRNAGKTIPGDSAYDPEPEEIQNADQGRDQPVHMTKTSRSADSCLYRQIASMQLHVRRLRQSNSSPADVKLLPNWTAPVCCFGLLKR